MPKATLRFTLPDEHSEFHTATHAADWRAIATDLDGEMRRVLKYGADKKQDRMQNGKLPDAATVQWLRDKLTVMLNELRLDIHED